MSKVTKQELASLPELLKQRIAFLGIDQKFIKFEGHEVKSCVLATQIYNEYVGGEIEEAFIAMVNYNRIDVSFVITPDIKEMSLRLVEAILKDVEQGIDIKNVLPEQLTSSAVIDLPCSAFYRIGVAGRVCYPREQYLTQYTKEILLQSEAV